MPRLDPRTWSRFARILLVITIIGLGIRVAYVVGAKLDEGTNIGDQISSTTPPPTGWRGATGSSSRSTPTCRRCWARIPRPTIRR